MRTTRKIKIAVLLVVFGLVWGILFILDIGDNRDLKKTAITIANPLEETDNSVTETGCRPTVGEINVEPLDGVVSVTEIGWRPMVKGEYIEPLSGVTYAQVALEGNEANNMATCRECVLASDGKPFSRYNPKTGRMEVYVVAKSFSHSTPRTIYFLMRNAPALRQYK